MTNFIKKRRWVLSLPLVFFLCFCSNPKNNTVILYCQNNTKSGSFEFVKYKDAPYTSLEDPEITKLIQGVLVDSMQINLSGNIFNGKPINLMSSYHEQAEFVYPVQKDDYLDIVIINGEQMFTIAILNQRIWDYVPN